MHLFEVCELALDDELVTPCKASAMFENSRAF
jgi:hypothetical protein